MHTEVSGLIMWSSLSAVFFFFLSIVHDYFLGEIKLVENVENKIYCMSQDKLSQNINITAFMHTLLINNLLTPLLNDFLVNRCLTHSGGFPSNL